MPKILETDDSQDELLNKLADSTEELLEDFEASESHALFVLGAKILQDEDGEEPGVTTYINAAGFYGILAEGLFAELNDQLAEGNTTLFSIFRDVVRDLEEARGIEPNEEIDVEDSPVQYH